MQLYIDAAAVAEQVIRSFQQGERHRLVLQFLSLSLVPSSVSDAPIMTPVLYFISHLLSKCFASAGDTLFVAGLDSFL